jgi:Domain of unknown function (DUF4157)
MTWQAQMTFTTTLAPEIQRSPRSPSSATALPGRQAPARPAAPRWRPSRIPPRAPVNRPPRLGHDVTAVPIHQPVLPGLTTSNAGDAYEQDADRAAGHASRTPAPQVHPASQRPQAASTTVAVALRPLQSPGQPLDATVRERMEPRLRHDFARVRVHTDAPAAEAAHAMGARAYTIGDHMVFGAGQYAPAAAGDWLLTHELAHVVQQAGGKGPMIQRKEVTDTRALRGDQDWTAFDRLFNTPRWQNACLHNLNAVDSTQYVRIVERRDFYKWFYEYTTSLGYSTRWALAAYIVANGAHQIADMDVEHAIANDTLEMADIELQGAMREGNQDIFDNVLPKLKKLVDGGKLTGRAALMWDMQILAEEQTLIQPMYKRMAPETVAQLDYIARKKRFAGWGAWWTDEDEVTAGAGRTAGTVPAFGGSSLLGIRDRWTYGMRLGSQFTPGGTGFDPRRDVMPTAGPGYASGSELARVDTRAALHELDAWLNPNRLTRMGPGRESADAYLQRILNKLSPAEKLQVLSDRSADGWAYSIQFAQFGLTTEAMVRQALPDSSNRQLQPAIAVFLDRYKAERARVNAMYPEYLFMPF